MHYDSQIPTGLVGVAPRDPVGVAVTMGIKGKGGAPMMKDRFWMMSPHAAATEFTSAGGKSYKSLAREPHPSFKRWNDLAKLGENESGRKGPGRVGSVRGNLVHAELKDAAFWNRSAQKLPEPHPNPPSQRPCCEGNGVTALRFSGIVNGEEQYDEIACPNEDCPFAMKGLCKPFASLLFRLRWDPNDEFERGFPSLLAMWSTRGWNSLRSLLGLFELVLGTEAVAPWEPPEKWRSGLAAELGLERVSLVGMPFVMTVSEKTKASEQRRFPVASFSPDGDLVEWLVHQKAQRALAGGTERLALPPMATRDPLFLENLRHDARRELDPSDMEEVQGEIVDFAPATALPDTTPAPETVTQEAAAAATIAATSPQPATAAKKESPAGTIPREEKSLSPEKASSLLAAAERSGGEDLVRGLEEEARRLSGTTLLTKVPQRFETDLMRFIEKAKKRGRR